MTANLMIHFLERFDETPFQVRFNGNDRLIGSGVPLFTVNFKKEIPLKSLTTSTSLALGEAYMNGDLEIEGDLYNALNSFIGQIGKFNANNKLLKKLIYPSDSKSNQRKEVSTHYDIGNDFYKMWLDKSLTYSCAYFDSETKTLEEAQEKKLDRILSKLYLRPGMSLLDIGCGWGSLLIKAAKEYGVHGVGITLSTEQFEACKETIRKEKLSDKIKIELLDYRDLPKKEWKFDRVVSVGMLEHVGRKNYPLFLSSVNSVLKPDGLFLLHFISALREYPGNAWIKKYIFPGGVIPSLREIVTYCSDINFFTLDIESLRRHYNKTLLLWDENFNQHRSEISFKMGEEFTRMWDLYLCSCAAAFSNGIVDLHQILLSKGTNNELPMTRWY